MAKIAAIHSGGDWADAGAEYLVLPDGMDIPTEKAAWRKWYEGEYCPALRAGGHPNFIGLHEWCIQRGAREPTPDELQVFEDI